MSQFYRAQRQMSGAPRTKVFVGHLPYGCCSDDLKSLFSNFGTVTECDVIDKYGFVHMQTPEEAEEAIRKLNNYNLMGSPISVEPSRSKLHLIPGAPGRAKGRGMSSNSVRRDGDPQRDGIRPQVGQGGANGFRSFEQPPSDPYFGNRPPYGQERMQPCTHTTFNQPSTTTLGVTVNDLQRALVTPAVTSRNPYTMPSSAVSRADSYNRFMTPPAGYLCSQRSPPRTLSFENVTSQNRPYGYFETVATVWQPFENSIYVRKTPQTDTSIKMEWTPNQPPADIARRSFY